MSISARSHDDKFLLHSYLSKMFVYGYDPYTDYVPVNSPTPVTGTPRPLNDPTPLTTHLPVNGPSLVNGHTPRVGCAL